MNGLLGRHSTGPPGRCGRENPERLPNPLSGSFLSSDCCDLPPLDGDFPECAADVHLVQPTRICWAPSGCQILSQVLGTKIRRKRMDSRSEGNGEVPEESVRGTDFWIICSGTCSCVMLDKFVNLSVLISSALKWGWKITYLTRLMYNFTVITHM